MLTNKRILLGVTGGIAVYKACDLTSKLVQQGADVRVVMTENAAKFVSPLTFQALSRNEVYLDTFDEKDPAHIAHIELADWADLVIIAPATANFISKMANGIGSDMLSTILLATGAEIYVAPAMNVHMYEHPAVIKNMQTLTDFGHHFIEPGAGYLACGYVGKGRLEEPLSIIQAINNHLEDKALFAGKKVLISAGPTREVIDPVRFLSNRSSGKTGFSLAEKAALYGAEVILVTGAVDLKVSHPNIKRIDVISAEDMYQKMMENYSWADIVIKSAAVSDYRPVEVHEDKVKKKSGNITLELERTKDTLKMLGEQKKHQFLVGFAAETRNAIAYGEKKLREKNLDAIVINNVTTEGAGFATDTNIVTYINKAGDKKEIPLATKQDIAGKLLQFIKTDMKDDNS